MLRIRRKITDYELAIDKDAYYPVNELYKIRNEYHSKDSPIFVFRDIPKVNYQFGRYIYVGDNYSV